jgi:hypothetical protein
LRGKEPLSPVGIHCRTHNPEQHQRKEQLVCPVQTTTLALFSHDDAPASPVNYNVLIQPVQPPPVPEFGPMLQAHNFIL